MLRDILFCVGFAGFIIGLLYLYVWYLTTHPPKPGDSDEYNGPFSAGSPH